MIAIFAIFDNFRRFSKLFDEKNGVFLNVIIYIFRNLALI
jgi:hypothetical protein